MSNKTIAEFFYIPERYDGPRAIDMKPSKELKKYHENSTIQINYNGEVMQRRITVDEQ